LCGEFGECNLSYYLTLREYCNDEKAYYKLYFITYLVYITIQYFHTENIKVRFLKIVLSDVIEIIVNLQQINKMESMIGLTQVFPYVYWTVHHCGS